jgi:hypothetical protein
MQRKVAIYVRGISNLEKDDNIKNHSAYDQLCRAQHN